jgi:hypothetical protein
MRQVVHQVHRCILAAVVCMTLAKGANAESDEDKAEAATQTAIELYNAGKVDEACALVVESERLAPRSWTVANMAFCLEQEGDISAAVEKLQAALALARQEGKVYLADRVQDRLDRLTRSLPTITLTRPASAWDSHLITVTLDGNPVATGALGSPLPVKSGEHLLTASQPGRVSWRATRGVSVGEHAVVAIPTLEPSPLQGGSSLDCRKVDVADDWFYVQLQYPWDDCGRPRSVDFWRGGARPAEFLDVTGAPKEAVVGRCIVVRVPEGERPPALLVSAADCEARVQEFPQWTECRTPDHPCRYELRTRPRAGAPGAPAPPTAAHGPHCNCTVPGATGGTTGLIGVGLIALIAPLRRLGRRKRATRNGS